MQKSYGRVIQKECKLIFSLLLIRTTKEETKDSKLLVELTQKMLLMKSDYFHGNKKWNNGMPQTQIDWSWSDKGEKERKELNCATLSNDDVNLPLLHSKTSF